MRLAASDLSYFAARALTADPVEQAFLSEQQATVLGSGPSGPPLS